MKSLDQVLWKKENGEETELDQTFNQIPIDLNRIVMCCGGSSPPCWAGGRCSHH